MLEKCQLHLDWHWSWPPPACLWDILAGFGGNAIIVSLTFQLSSHVLFLYVLQHCLFLLWIPWSLPILWLTDPLAHVQICTLPLYITPTAHFTFTLVSKTETVSWYTPPPRLFSSVFPPYGSMTAVSLRDGEAPMFLLPHPHKGMMNVSVRWGTVRGWRRGQGLVRDNNA